MVTLFSLKDNSFFFSRSNSALQKQRIPAHPPRIDFCNLTRSSEKGLIFLVVRELHIPVGDAIMNHQETHTCMERRKIKWIDLNCVQ